jgi:(1->4)-alpha-D-glucan 1-alpha-D-glucosylmutase
MKQLELPQSTYRIQLTQKFTFKDLGNLLEYFSQLGISHFYFSPILKAKSGTSHGYDITDPTQLNPEIGSLQVFENLVEKLHEKSMGIILDIVPNHMYIGNNENPWWNSVLEKGQSSPFADYFDIDWHPPKHVFDNKIYLPILDQVFGKAIENQTLKVDFKEGHFLLYVNDLSLPTEPNSWKLILEPLYNEIVKENHKDDSNVLKLKSIIEELGSVDLSKQLQNLFDNNPFFYEKLKKHLENLNGNKENPLSFDLLEKFLNAQHYRLCYWRIANDEINYRRFFDVFEYASIRIENEETFKAVHQLVFTFIKNGWVNGLRIDHIDGLWDPQKYLDDLSKNIDKSTYLIAEKILMGNEKMRCEWPIDGGVGYSFLNQVNGVFVYTPHEEKFLEIYRQFTGHLENIEDQKYKCKKLILNSSLASELHLLTLRLNAIAEKHRYFRDFPFDSLKKALAEIIACFPVYRTYIRSIDGIIHEDDRKSIAIAIAKARRRNFIVDRSIYEFIENILFFRFPDGVEIAFKASCGDFVMHFQQITGPVMAKGLEDTAFYRYFPLVSLNEVGGDPRTFGISKDTFHKKNIERLEKWPHSLLATTTHDTKRSEDVRARINLLSEMPEEWKSTLSSWNQINKKHKKIIGDETVPDHNEEYLLYQTLLGTWPFEAIDENYINRIQKYMEKAIKEAKLNSSWMDPNENYDQAVKQFIQKILADPLFLESFTVFFYKISQLGMLNSLSQLILKLTSPGIPDIYQGNEFWDFSLVDPDNRHPIDFLGNKQKMLPLIFQEILKTPQDGKIKFFITQKLLALRKEFPNVFSEGSYLIVDTQGIKSNHILAYARKHQEKIILIITSRFFSFFMRSFNEKTYFWSDMIVELPKEISKYQFRDIFSETTFPKQESLELKDCFLNMPFAVLESF